MAKPFVPEKLNVCIVARSFPISGRATGFSFLRLIARGLVARGHKVTVLSGDHPQGRPEVRQDGVRVCFLLEGRSRSRRDQFPNLVKAKFVEFHSTEPFDLVHSVDRSAIRISRSKRNYRVAIAYDVAATHLAEMFSILGMSQETLFGIIRTGLVVISHYLVTYFRFDRRLLASADGIFVNSPREKIALERYYLFPDVKTHVVPYGIEIGDLSPRERSDELRTTLGIPEGAPTAVTLSDMTEVEEVANILAAFEQIAIKKPNARLLIVGSGPKFKEIEREMLDLALGSRVIFTGEVKDTDIPDYIALADIFINLSSRSTGFEPSLLEAMAQKKVIVGSEVSPIATIVEHSHDGFLIRPADIEELSALMLDIFNGRLPVAEIGEAAHRKVLDLFDAEKMVIETLDAYYDVLRSSGYYRTQASMLNRVRDFLFAFD